MYLIRLEINHSGCRYNIIDIYMSANKEYRDAILLLVEEHLHYIVCPLESSFKIHSEKQKNKKKSKSCFPVLVVS